MKLKIALSLTAGTLIASTAAQAQFTGTDEYWGGTPTSNKAKWQSDVIGNPISDFDITSWSVDIGASGSLPTMTVTIFSDYFRLIDLNSSKLLGTSMGDLFISTDGLAWDLGGAPTLSDTAFTGTSWEYAVALGTYTDAGDQISGTMGADVFAVTDTNNIELSAANGIYRKHQEVRYDGSNQQALSTASWELDPAGSLAITLNPQFLGSGIEDLGFHWTMSCGNDVLEFEIAFDDVTAVPEPSIIALLSVLSLGVIVYARRKRTAAA